jgi:TonB-dependent SusC/RagA subfamily outer membrane receptor
MRQVLLACAVLLLIPGWGVAQGTVPPSQAANLSRAPVQFEMGPGAIRAPVLQKLIALELREATLTEALQAVSSQLDSRLMFADSDVGDRRVTLVSGEIRASTALERILAGTGLGVIIPDGGSAVLVKPIPVTEPEQQPQFVALAGRVIDSGTGGPVAQVLVTIDGGTQRSMTNEHGRFVFLRVPVGQRAVSFERIGYRPVTEPVVLVAGQDKAITVNMTSEPIRMEELVATVSGQEMRYRVGNSIARIDVATEAERFQFRDLSDILASRSDGVIVTPGGGSTNSPTRLRIRGLNSINASNDPIVIIDGVRALSGFRSCSDGNLPGCDNVPSRFDDLDINSIETLEVLKGPAAAAMWGSEASAGVIVITTNRGQPGPTRWRMQYDEGFAYAPTDLRVPVQGLGSPVNGTAVMTCTIQNQAAGLCVPIDSILGGFNRFTDPRTTSVATGRTRQYDISASGGAEAVQFFLAGGFRDEVGTSKMPEIDQKMVRESLGQALPDWMIRPDGRTSYNFTGRLTGQLGDRLRYGLTTNYVHIDSRSGPDGVMGATSDLRTEADTLDLSRGWESFYVQREHQASRFTGSLMLNWNPTTWFSGRAVVGRDFAYTDDGAYRRRGWCLPYCNTTSQDATGRVDRTEGRDMAQTVDLGGQLNVPIMDGAVTLHTAAGAQHTRVKTFDFRGTAHNLPVGRIDFNAAPAANRNVFQSSAERATFGVYVHQTVGMHDRLFLSGAVRRDIGSALGAEVAPLYPKFAVSWVASQEPLFGLADRDISLRLRTAYGHAGMQPSETAKYRSFGQSSNFVDLDGSHGGIFAWIGGMGNAELRPERTREMEGGFELGFWRDRVMFDFTYFHKFTMDAIVSRHLAPSLGLFSTTRQWYNVGDVRNTGIEASVVARLLEMRGAQLSLNVGYAARENMLVSLGEGVEPFSITASNIDLATIMANDGVVMPGYPLFGRWARPVLGYSDRNGDGLITADEIRLGDELVFMGPSQPKADVTIMPSLTLWNGRVGMYTNFGYIHGLTQLNQWAANMRHFTAAAYDPDTPLHVQACYAAAAPPYNNQYCFYETTNILRLRTASVRFALPRALTDWMGASTGNVSILGSNLGVWTAFDGIDPMVNTASPSGNRNISSAVMPRGKTFTFRTNLSF